MNLPLFVASRHLFSRHKIGYISFISIISIVGLSIGVAALILTTSILNGFEKEIKTKLMGLDSHARLRVFDQESMHFDNQIEKKLLNLEEVKYIAPYIHSQAIIHHGKEADGVIVEGMCEKDIKNILNIDEFIKQGELNFHPDDGVNGVVMGEKLANFLDVRLGDYVYLFVRYGSSEISSRPRIRKFKVTGLYSSGISEYDDIFVYVGLDAAQDLLNLGEKFSGYQILLSDPYRIDQFAYKVNEIIGFPYQILTWKDLHYNLFEWLDVQKIPIILVFSLIAAVAIFNIVSALMMIVMEKKRDIGILKSMGFNRRGITSIFLIEGLIIGIIGTVIGSIIAWILGNLQIRFGLISIPEEVYYMNRLPVILSWKSFLLIGISAILFSVIATIHPSLKASKLLPAECTRYE